MMLKSLLQILLLLSASVNQGREGGWWSLIPEGFRLIFPLVLFFVNLFVLAIVLYLAGLVVVGGERARMSDAFLISLLGTVLSTLFFMFIPFPLAALLLGILVWLLLIKSRYETGWLGAIGVGIMTIMVFLAVTIILALLFGILNIILERFFSFMTLTF